VTQRNTEKAVEAVRALEAVKALIETDTQTHRPIDPQTHRPADLKTCRPEDLKSILGRRGTVVPESGSAASYLAFIE
jgi:hypothetical protein